jgi:heme-degrading monooxygenase HmoA
MEHALEHWASGNWTVQEGKEDEFVERWKDWLGWSSENIAGFVSATLIRDTENPRHFVSFSDWTDDQAKQGWQSLDEFSEKMGACRELCEDFQKFDFTRVASV